MTSKRKKSFDLRKGRIKEIKPMVDEIEKPIEENPEEETTKVSEDLPEAESPVDLEAKENLV